MKNDLTSAVYFASKDPRIVALKDLAAAPDRLFQEAQKLNDAGLIIDQEIDINRWDPVLVMAGREQYGYPWVPNAFQGNLVDPLNLGVVPAGSVRTDMSQPWPRSIKVSTDSTDFPPVAPPVTTPNPPHDAVLMDYGNGILAVDPSVAFVNGKPLFNEGDQITHEGKPIIWHWALGFAGRPSPIWETAEHRAARVKQEGA